jgi:Pyruvate/2-oxoacid:ferredoxin oxidoreductase delta subunit
MLTELRMKPYLLDRRCPAQKDLCKAIAACSKGAVRYIVDEQAPLGGRIIFDYDQCDGCGQCVTECCGKAIEMR